MSEATVPPYLRRGSFLEPIRSRAETTAALVRWHHVEVVIHRQLCLQASALIAVEYNSIGRQSHLFKHQIHVLLPRNRLPRTTATSPRRTKTGSGLVWGHVCRPQAAAADQVRCRLCVDFVSGDMAKKQLVYWPAAWQDPRQIGDPHIVSPLSFLLSPFPHPFPFPLHMERSGNL